MRISWLLICIVALSTILASQSPAPEHTATPKASATNLENACSQWQRTPAFKSKTDCEEAMKVNREWSSFCAKAEEKAGLWPENLSATDRSEYDFCQIEDAKETTNSILYSHKNNEKVQESWKSFRGEVLSHWADTKDVFFMFHASALYLVDGDHVGAHCPADDQYAGVPDKKAMDKIFNEDETLSSNIMTFSDALVCEDMTDSNAQRDCMQRQVDANKPLLDAIRKK